eukprot:441668_1
MARRLRLYSHPLTGRVKGKASELGAYIPKNATSFIKYVPRNISPISHVIIPQTTGLDPNAHLTPLKGYRVRFKGKILERTLKSNIFKFRTGHTRKADHKSWNYEEGYSVHGPFGVVGVKVYYEYELEPYFGSNEKYSTDINQTDKKKETTDNEQFKYKISDQYDLDSFDQIEDPKTQQLLLDSNTDL